MVVVTEPAALVATTAGPEETRALAGAIAELCEPGDVLLLAGDLGSGKTTFAQGFGAGLGVTEPITSPTFALVRQYRLGDGTSLRTLLHADVYRLDHLAEIADLGLGELVEDGAVALVEWGDVAEPVLGDGSLSLRLDAGPGDPDDRRTVTILWSGPRWADRWERLSGVVTRWAGVR
jgi:tRNA threonylcarbamoyladenosine biosynthesis protein TsaE